MAKSDKTASDADVNSLEAGAKPSQPFPLVPFLNSLTLLASLGLLYYWKMVYKRPAITEMTERARLEAIEASPTPPPIPAYVSFEPVTVNIEATPERPSPADGTSRQILGKLHYATIGFSLEIRDRDQQDVINTVRPQIMDKLLTTVGKKKFHELTTVQGRYILQSQIMDFTNQLISTHLIKPMKEGLVTNVYFTQFIVQ